VNTAMTVFHKGEEFLNQLDIYAMDRRRNTFTYSGYEYKICPCSLCTVFCIGVGLTTGYQMPEGSKNSESLKATGPNP
jgi:hypothetical protein